MAHVDAPRGLRWVGSIHGGKSAPPMHQVIIPASTTLYRGCMVTVTNAGVIALTGAAAFSASTTRLLGIAPGYLPSQSVVTPFSLINPVDQIFEVQAGNSTTALDTLAEINTAISLGTRFGFLTGNAAVSGLNQSAMELDLAATGTTDGTHIFQIVGYPDRPGNAIEATTGDLKVWVRVHPGQIANALQV